MMEELTEDDVREIAWKEAQPTHSAWCRAHEVHRSNLSDFLAGRRHAAPDLLAALGLERRIVETIVRVRKRK